MTPTNVSIERARRWRAAAAAVLAAGLCIGAGLAPAAHAEGTGCRDEQRERTTWTRAGHPAKAPAIAHRVREERRVCGTVAGDWRPTAPRRIAAVR